MVTKEKLHELRTSYFAKWIKLVYKKDGISIEMRDFIDYYIYGENVTLGFSGNCSIKLPLERLFFINEEKCFYVKEN